MLIRLILLSFLSLAIVEVVRATSFGRTETADITTIDKQVAICLPHDAGKVFSVGWISLSESYVRHAGSWGVSLKSGGSPLVLSPGDCVVFGVVPNGYELDDYKIQGRPLQLGVNRTYVFSLIDARRPRDSYTAIFCVNENADGSFEFLQYVRSADGTEVIPVCDAKRKKTVG